MMRKMTYVRPEIMAVEMERLMDNELTSGGGSIFSDVNAAKGVDPYFDSYFYGVPEDGDTDQERGLQSMIDTYNRLNAGSYDVKL